MKPFLATKKTVNVPFHITSLNTNEIVQQLLHCHIYFYVDFREEAIATISSLVQGADRSRLPRVIELYGHELYGYGRPYGRCSTTLVDALVHNGSVMKSDEYLRERRKTRGRSFRQLLGVLFPCW